MEIYVKATAMHCSGELDTAITTSHVIFYFLSYLAKMEILQVLHLVLKGGGKKKYTCQNSFILYSVLLLLYSSFQQQWMRVKHSRAGCCATINCDV